MSGDPKERREAEDELARRLDEREAREAPERVDRIEGEDGSEDELFEDVPV